MAKLTVLDPSLLDTLLRDNKQIWIKNMSDPSSAISLTFHNGVKREPTLIPVTYIPLNLSLQFTPKVLQEGSMELRTCLMRSTLVLVDPDDAEAFMKDPEAKAEYTRLYKSAFAGSMISANASVFRDKAQKNAARSAALEDKTDERPLVNPRLEDLIGQLREKEVPVRDALNQIRGFEHTLQKEDFIFLLKESTDPAIKTFAKDHLKEFDLGESDMNSIEASGNATRKRNQEAGADELADLSNQPYPNIDKSGTTVTHISNEPL